MIGRVNDRQRDAEAAPYVSRSEVGSQSRDPTAQSYCDGTAH